MQKALHICIFSVQKINILEKKSTIENICTATSQFIVISL